MNAADREAEMLFYFRKLNWLEQIGFILWAAWRAFGVWLLLIIATLMRVATLGTAQLWYDEAGTTWMASLPFTNMLAATAGDTHPPLYLALIWLVERVLGPNEFAVRLPSAVLGVAALWLTYQVAKRLQLSTAATWGALVFMCVSSFQLHFSQETRMYALLQVEVLVMLLALLDRKWLLFGIAASAALWTHNYALFYVAVLGTVALVRELLQPFADCQAPRVVLAVVLPGVSFIPWAIVLWQQMSQVAAGYWIQPITSGDVAYALNMLYWGFAMPDQFKPLAMMVAAGASVYATARGIKAGRWTLLALAWGPLIIAVVASLVWKPLLLARALIGSAPALYLLVACAIPNVRYKQLYALVLVVPLTLAGVWGYYANTANNKGNASAQVAVVRNEWRAGDVILHINEGTRMDWWLYSRDLPQYLLRTDCPRNVGALSQATKDAMLMQFSSWQELPDRVWVVWADAPTSTICEEQAAQAIVANGTRKMFMSQTIDDPNLIAKLPTREYAAVGVWLIQKEK